ncbi:MAG TPA: alpha/beta hydrolase [Ignavibacteriaceae bacterium]|nr:alpha/beta hydrolase [Ignavibacteriaceae bacterium]
MMMQYEVTGSGSPIVLVPGGLTGWLSWETHAKILSENHTVIRVQLISVQLGYEDKMLPDDYSIKTESNALKETLDYLGYNYPVDIVGWSFGAFTSLTFAIDNPNRVRTLTLIEPPALWVLRQDGKLDEQTAKEREFFITLQGDITEDMLAKFLVHAGFIKEGEDARKIPQWNKWINFKRSLRNSLTVANYQDDLNKLRNLNIPVLLVKGTGSSAWLHRVIDTLGKSIPNSRIIELPEGHGPHLVSMNEFLNEVDKFQKEANETFDLVK